MDFTNCTLSKMRHMLARRRTGLSLAILAAAPYSAYADDRTWTGSIYDALFQNESVRFETSAGVSYDSNVSIIDIDTSSAKDDFAANLEAEFNYKTPLGENTELNFGYSFGQDLQFELTEFDTQIHRASVGLDHSIGDVTGALSYHYVHARVGGEGFLKLHYLSPSLSTFAFDKKAYIRLAYIYSDKDFIGQVERDATTHSGGVDAYYFFNGVKTFIVAGYQYGAQNAVASEFDYDAHETSVKYVQRIPIAGKNLSFSSAWQYEDRDYSSLTPSIDMARSDQRYKFDVGLEIPITEKVYTEFEYNYDIYISNLPSADFNQNVASIRIGGRL